MRFIRIKATSSSVIMRVLNFTRKEEEVEKSPPRVHVTVKWFSKKVCFVYEPAYTKREAESGKQKLKKKKRKIKPGRYEWLSK